MIERLHALLVALPAFAAEPTPETADERAARLEPVAAAIWQATETTPAGFTRGQWAAVIAAVGWHESRYATYVTEGRCSEGPVGMRCDGGRAIQAWQQWQPACPAAWRLPHGSREQLNESARCASRLLVSALRRCRSRAPSVLAGAFSGYAGASCVWKPAQRRERTARNFMGRLGV